jgi:ubiquinone/menaquinone biosynthesis C-methylase UbiE
MTQAETFKKMFRGAVLEIEDIFLLEAFQIAYLPGWVPEREFAAILWAHPALKRFLAKRNPSVRPFLERLLDEHGSAPNPEALAVAGDQVVWTIADLLVYNKCPEVYDALEFHGWDFGQVTSITSLEGKRVVDAGAGTGRVALEAARHAAQVFAVEPVGRLRQFIRDRADKVGLDNLFVVDGFLRAIPLPDDFAQVLITSHALGWDLEEELAELERVVRPGGHIIHCPGTAEIPGEEAQHRHLISPAWGYRSSRYREADGWKRKYWKQLSGTSAA